MIGDFQIAKSTRKLILAVILATMFLGLSLVLLRLNAWAAWRSSGEGNCGNFIDAVAAATNGDTVAVMLSERNSEGTVISKNLLIHGSWLETGPNGCDGTHNYTTTTELDAASFQYQGEANRSILSYGTDSVIQIAPSVVTLTVQNMAFHNFGGGATANGGGISGVISNAAKVRLDNIVISQSEVSNAGGGLKLEVRGGSQLTMVDSAVISNEAAQTGGGLDIDVYNNSKVTLNRVQVISNVATSGNGGGARIRFHSGGVVTITHSSFQGNQAPGGNGPALAIENLSSTPATVWLIGNQLSATQIYSAGSNLTVYNLSNQIYLPATLKSSNANKVLIKSISIVNNRYQVAFETVGYTPALPGQHIHFFFNTVPPSQAGVPGSGPWLIHGSSAPFTGYSVIDRPPGAWQMCALVANPNHSVQSNSGNCYDLP